MFFKYFISTLFSFDSFLIINLKDRIKIINVIVDKNDKFFDINIVDRNEGRLWATGWQGQMTAYVKYETSNCGACVNDALYLFYSIFFMSLLRQILD